MEDVDPVIKNSELIQHTFTTLNTALKAVVRKSGTSLHYAMDAMTEHTPIRNFISRFLKPKSKPENESTSGPSRTPPPGWANKRSAILSQNEVNDWWRKHVKFTVFIDEDWDVAKDWYAENPLKRLVVTPQPLHDITTWDFKAVSVGELLKAPHRYEHKELLFVDAVQILKTIFHVEDVYGCLIVKDDDQNVTFVDAINERAQAMRSDILHRIEDDG